MVISGGEWTEEERSKYLESEPNQSTMAHIPFLRYYFSSVIGKRQWVVLPYSVSKELPGLSLIPLGVKNEHDRRPKWIGYYSYSKLNSETLTIATLFAMQYRRMLDSLIREVVITEPVLGPIYVLKADVSDRFNRIDLKPKDASKLGLISPSEIIIVDLVAIPLTLPMV